MTVRRILAAFTSGAAALLMLAATAQAAPTITTEPCARSAEGLGGGTKMTIAAAGFTPGSLITIAYTSKATPAIRLLTSGTADATGAYTANVPPPPFTGAKRTEQTFTLAASDNVNPAAVATTQFRQVRIGYDLKPSSARPASKVLHTARGFVTGLNVYIHYRFNGQTKKTVKLGKAKGPCGIVSKRMSFLPVRPARTGIWSLYIDHALKYSKDTPGQLVTGLRISTRFR